MMKGPFLVLAALTLTLLFLFSCNVAGTPDDIDFTVSGLGNDVRFGKTLATGDFNGDGFDDLAVGAPEQDYQHTDAGALFIYFGPVAANITADDANALYRGDAGGDMLGYALSSGDVNCDGLDDIVVSAPFNDEQNTNTGMVYILYGRTTGWSFNVSIDNYANASYMGLDHSDKVGISVAAEGDVNGDGYDDVVIGAPFVDSGDGDAGKVYIFFGRRKGWNKQGLVIKANASYNGMERNDRCGHAADSGADMNGDGYDDILVSAPRSDVGDENSGQVFVIFGRRSKWNTNKDITKANVTFTSSKANESIGVSLELVPSINGDIYDEIMIGSVGNLTDPGTVYLFYGTYPAGWSKNNDINSAAHRFTGESNGDEIGRGLAGLGDLTGDGYGDIAIAATMPNASSGGRVYVFEGGDSISWGYNVDLGDALFTFNESTAGSYLGYSVCGGDLDGDLIDDLIIGAPQEGISGGKGEVHIFYNYSNALPVASSLTLFLNSSYNQTGEFVVLRELIYIQVNGTDPDNGVANIAGVRVTSSGFSKGIVVRLYETNLSTGVYRGTVRPTLRHHEGHSWIRANWGDRIYVTIGAHNETQMVNVPPVITNGDVLTINEDSLYTVDYTALDGNGDDVNWSATFDGDWLNWSHDPARLYGQPHNLEIGSYNISIRVWDGKEGEDWRNFTLTVNNTPPTITTTDITWVNEDNLYSVDYENVDENVGAWWVINTNASWLTIDNLTGLIEGTPTNDDIGSYWVNVTAFDGNGAWDTHNFTLNAINVPLMIMNEDVNITQEDNWYSVTYVATDTGTGITWSMTTGTDWLNFDPDNRTLYGIPDNWDVGLNWVNVSVDDGQGGSDHSNFTINVTNRAPWFTVDTFFDAPERTFFELNITSDDDGTGTTYSFESDAGWLTLDEGNAQVRGTPVDSDVGTYVINVTVSDLNGGNTSTKIYLDVDNLPPNVTIPANLTATEDSFWSWNFTSTDDPHTTWTLDAGPGFITLNSSNGIVFGTPDNSHVGWSLLNLTCSDSNGGDASVSIPLTVNNVAPDITTSPPQIAFEDSLYQVQFQANDTGPAVRWELETADDWLSIDPITGLLEGTPHNDNVTEPDALWVKVTVTDGNGGNGSLGYYLRVNNTIPTITNSPPATVKELVNFTFDISSAEEGLDASYSMLGAASWLSINSSTGVISGLPRNEHVGKYKVNVTLDDGHDGFAWLEFNIEVENTVPVVTTTPPGSVLEKTLYLYDLNSTDDGPGISWIKESGPSWLTIDEDTGELNGTPTNDDIGLASIKVIVFDGNGGEGNITFDINVINTPPTITTMDVPFGNEDQLYRVEYRSSDDGADASWNLTTNAEWLGISGGVLSGTPDDADVGTFWVKVRLDDGHGASALASFNLTINNSSPTITPFELNPIDEDEPFELNLSSTDPVFDPFWDIDTDADWLSVDEETGRVWGTPNNEDIGLFVINVSVSDRHGSGQTRTLNLTVVNVLPEIFGTPPPSVDEDSLYSVNWTTGDTGPGVLWFFEGPEWLGMDNRTGIMYGTPDNDDVGGNQVIVTLVDGNGGNATRSILIEVKDVNDHPLIISDESHVVNGTEVYTAQFWVEDVDSPTDLHKWSARTDADWLIFSDKDQKVLFGTPSNQDVGVYWVNISILDGEGGLDWRNFSIRVDYKNTAPILSNGKVSPLKGDDDTTYHFTVWYTDMEEETPTEIYAVIDGVYRPMKLSKGDGFNGLYILKTKLDRGKHSYFFNATEGNNYAISGDETPIEEGETISVKIADDSFQLTLELFLILLFLILLVLLVVFLFRHEKLIKISKGGHSTTLSYEDDPDRPGLSGRAPPAKPVKKPPAKGPTTKVAHGKKTLPPRVDTPKRKVKRKVPPRTDAGPKDPQNDPGSPPPIPEEKPPYLPTKDGPEAK